jgi:hypothetical protein
VKKKMGRHLPKTKLPGCYDRLVELITGLEDPIRGTHANWEKAGPNHNGVKAPSVGVMGNIGQSEGSRVLEKFRIGIRKKVCVIKAFIESPEPAGSIWRIQFPARETVQSLPETGAPNLSPAQIREGIADQGREIGVGTLEIKMGPQLDEPPWATSSDFLLRKKARGHQMEISVKFPKK